VRDVSLQLAAGEILAFLGPNGAGKTTTIKIIAGLIQPDHGQVKIGGLDPYRDPQALRMLGAVLEGNRNVYWRLTPEENLDYFGVLKGLSRRVARQRGSELLERFDLSAKRNLPTQTLSRGMQQKLAIAVALIHSPQLLLLDEPTLGLDVEATQTVKTLITEIAKDGQAIILTTHQLDIAQMLSDRVAIIQKGSIIAEAVTRDLIRQFAGSSYRIEVEGTLDPVRVKLLESFSATVQGEQIRFTGTTADLYQLLEILKPLPLIEVKKEDADLTQIFLKLVRAHA
jgi:ABC-2 type transport system ATP-binding protein